MSWFILFIAGLLEVVWAIGLKYTQGFTKLTPSLVTVSAMNGSFYLLSVALKELPLGTLMRFGLALVPLALQPLACCFSPKVSRP